MYIWFSQYMLIWYANIPEETSYFITRTHGAWGPIVVMLIVLNWVVPFFVLLPRPAKRSPSVMMKISDRRADWPLGGFVRDGLPVDHGADAVFGLWEIAAICALVGAGSLLLMRSLSKAEAVPRAILTCQRAFTITRIDAIDHPTRIRASAGFWLLCLAPSAPFRQALLPRIATGLRTGWPEGAREPAADVRKKPGSGKGAG